MIKRDFLFYFLDYVTRRSEKLGFQKLSATNACFQCCQRLLKKISKHSSFVEIEFS